MRKNYTKCNFLIVGLARNCSKVISKEVKTIDTAFKEAASVKWLIIESDSDDNTVSILKSLSKNYNLNYITLGKLREQYPKRTERIAMCRNRYLQEINNNSLYNNIDYVVVADLDGVNKGLTAEAIKKCWKVDVDWDACFANQSAPYYDIWALRHDFWNPSDPFKQEDFYKQLNVNEFSSRYNSVTSKMIKIPSSAKPIKVKSAFGGLGLYKKNLLSGCKYIGIDQNLSEVCEHVNLHTDYLYNANLYIIPSLINSGWNQHSIQKTRIYTLLLFFATRFFTIASLKKTKNNIANLFK